MLPWWDEDLEKLTCNMRFATYQVGFLEILVGNQPYKTQHGAKSFTGHTCRREFFDSINAWISVNDTITHFPLQTSYFWMPWWEPEPPPEMLVKSFIALMNQLQERVGRIYLHCQAGQHRSPTMLGLWLLHQGITEIKPVTLVGLDAHEVKNPIDRAREHLAETPEIANWIKPF